MELSYIDLRNISDEELNQLVSINKWVDKVSETEVCVVKDNDDIKAVYCLKEDFDYTGRNLHIGVKDDKKSLKYCIFGLYGILEAIKNDPSIESVTIISDNNLVDVVCMKAGLKKGQISRIFFYDNPNFDPDYKLLEEKIINEEPKEDLIEFCNGNKRMLNILNIWLKRIEKEKQARERLKEKRTIYK